MCLYMIVFLLIVNIMFFRAIKIKHICYQNKYSVQEKRTSKPLPFWFYVVGLIIVLTMIVSNIALTGISGFGGNIANTMAKSYSFVQGGGVYQEGVDIPMWIYMHFALFIYLSIVDGIIYYKKLSFLRKMIWIVMLVALVLYFALFKGTQKTLGDIFVLCMSALLVKSALLSVKRKKSKRIIIVLVGTAVIFACVLASIMGARISYLNSLGYNAFRLHDKFWDVNVDSTFLQLFPKATRIGFACLVFYLCNGLCGLSYCLALPITWSYGIGSITDLADIIERRFGFSVIEKTYMYKAYKEYGWHYNEQWHTIFPSIASDWSFVGALIILGIIAYIYGICWQEIIHGENKESIFLFSMINIIWIYLPANNQIFSTRTTAIIFVICIIMWIRRNKNVKKKWFFYEKG